MTLDVLSILGGLILLGIGGEALVRGAVGLAQRFHLTPAVIGLTVVAAGTSMPELVVSVLAALRGNPDIALANVVGSNIFNIGLVLGTTAIVLPMPVGVTTQRIEWPFLCLITLAVFPLARDGVLGPLEGAIMVVLLTVFMVGMVRRARSREKRNIAVTSAINIEGITAPPEATKNLIVLTVGIAMLVVGARLIVAGAVDIATSLGVSQRMIGLTIVAMGTSLPELASSLVAALRGHSDVAVGNLVGSSIFNILGILGVGALVTPMTVNPELLRVDIPWMLGFTLVLGPLIFLGRSRTVGRGEGIILAVLFVAYMAMVITKA